jgi:uracil-DNA glycosylase
LFRLHTEISQCRKCSLEEFSTEAFPLVKCRDVAPVAPAPFMVIGQAPSLTDKRAGLIYQGPAAQKLIEWLKEAGFSEKDIGTNVYMTALTKCFPGRLPGKSTDRAPSKRELGLCRPWLLQEIEIVSPKVIVLFGKMAIDLFIHPSASLSDRIGQSFEIGEIGKTLYIPLPHSSGASTWLNSEEHRALLKKAIDLISQAREKLM